MIQNPLTTKTAINSYYLHASVDLCHATLKAFRFFCSFSVLEDSLYVKKEVIILEVLFCCKTKLSKFALRTVFLRLMSLNRFARSVYLE